MEKINDIEIHPEISELINLYEAMQESASVLRESWNDTKSDEFFQHLYNPIDKETFSYIGSAHEALMKLESASKLSKTLLNPLSGVGYETKNYRWLSFNDIVFVGRREFLKIFNLDGWG